MRTDNLVLRAMQRGFARNLLLLAVLSSAACHEADGTDEWPGVYPAEADIDRPKMKIKPPTPKDAGSDAGSTEDASTDSEASVDGGATSDATVSEDG